MDMGYILFREMGYRLAADKSGGDSVGRLARGMLWRRGSDRSPAARAVTGARC